MTVSIPTGYTVPLGSYGLSNARILWDYVPGTPSASGTAAGYYEAAPNIGTTYEYWKPDADNATWALTFDATATVDCVCIAAHTLGTVGATVTIQHNAGAGWVTLATITPANDSPIMALFAAVTTDAIRISVSDADAIVGVVRCGVAMVMPQMIYGGHSPIDLARNVTTVSNASSTGAYLGTVRVRTSLGATYSWQHIPAQWVRTYWHPFRLAAEVEPFFIAWRPALNRAHSNDVAYIVGASFDNPTNDGGKAYQTVGFNGTGLAWE